MQTVCKNRVAADQEMTAEKLADRFQNGYRIDVESYAGFIPHAAHQEVQLRLKPMNKRKWWSRSIKVP